LFRLNVIPIHVPPLRERPDDIPALVQHFSLLHQARTGRRPPHWSAGALSLLALYRWPGNVSELANIVERLAILHPGAEMTGQQVEDVLIVDREGETGLETQPITPTRARVPVTTARGSSAPGPTSLAEKLDSFERTVIARALAEAGGNVADAARRLQTDRPNLYRRMKRLGINATRV
jgi:two-component system nitrogen regulation response regulator NtrX